MINRSVSFKPIDGELTIMNYRLDTKFNPPFRCYFNYEEVGSSMADFILKLSPNFPSDQNATNLAITFKVPSSLQRLFF